MTRILIRWLSGPAVALLLWLLPLDLDPEAHRMAGLMAWVILWWIFEPIPLPATALLGATLAVLLGIADARKAFAPFADPVIFLFLGGFLLAQALNAHRLDQRLALKLICHPLIIGRPWRSLMALLGVTAFLSMWISNTATTAIMLPIGLSVAASIFPHRPNERGIAVLGIAYASSIGGLATPIGSPPNIVAIGMLERLAGISLGFLDWMLFALPTAVVLMGVLFVVLKKSLPELPRRQEATDLRKKLLSLGPLSLPEKGTLAIATLAVALWLLPDLAALALGDELAWVGWLGGHLSPTVVAVLAGCLLFIFPAGNGRGLLTWSEATQLDWGTLLLFGGGLSLGTLLFETGLAGVIGDTLFRDSLGAESFWVFTFIAVLATLFFTETTSNTAAANMLIPLLIAAAQQSGNDPLIPVLGAALACSLAFMMPIGTPPNAIAYSSGLIPMGTMMRKGLVLNLLSVLVVMLALLAIRAAR